MQTATLPDRDYSGYIFDLDGTLVDSMPLHYKAWRLALAEAGAPDEAFLPEEFYSCGGKSVADVVQYLNARYHLDMAAEPVAENKRRHYYQLMAKEGAAPIDAIARFARSLKGTAPMAIATGSALPGAMLTLKAAGLDGLFDIIITPDDVRKGKPAPDMFLLAAQRMDVDPADCVVFEDAAPGIEAAKAAGMACVVVATPPEYLRADS